MTHDEEFWTRVYEDWYRTTEILDAPPSEPGNVGDLVRVLDDVFVATADGWVRVQIGGDE